MPDDLSPVIITGLALELVANVARKRLQNSRGPAPWLTVAFDMIQECYSEKLTLQGMASSVGVPPIFFGRCFRKAFGCSAGEMLRRTRVARAEELLQRHTLPIAEIALACGFADQAQLTKTFRRVTGITPAQSRGRFT